MRINRFIARSGVTSRRKAEDLILGGNITVNGNVIRELTTEIEEDKDEVQLNGNVIKIPKYKYIMFAKPCWYTTTKSDPYAKHTIFELLPKDSSLFPVGRLDLKTSGLLLVTNDGDFAQNIIHPSNKIEKEYEVRLKREIQKDDIKSLIKGVELEDGKAKAKNIKTISKKEITLTIEEGRKRIVRRMIEAVGNEVTGLNRRRIGNIVLDIPIGEYRKLTEAEVQPYE